MQARDTTVEESTDGEQVDLEELMTTPLDIFLSDVSPEPETRQSSTEPPAVPVSSAEIPPLTLAQQLRAASLQAAQLETCILRCQHTMSIAELNIWSLKTENGILSDKLTELELDMGLQTFDLSVHKELYKYQETTRQSLSDQLAFVTSELLSTREKLAEAQTTVKDLQAQVRAYQINDQDWQ